VSGLFTALVVDADLDGPVPWLATAYVAGPSLAEVVQRHGPLPVMTLLALAAGLAESLNAIHASGVVHRDLKPSNVLLAEDGPRVIDFGISEAAEASALASAKVVIGSAGFMSPEQVLGLGVGPPSDMFSLGAVLAYAGMGKGPFGSGSTAAVVQRVVNCPPKLNGLPDEVRSLVGNCLAKHPSDRPTAPELLGIVGAMQPARGWLSESIIYGGVSGSGGEERILRPAGTRALTAADQFDRAGRGRHARRRFAVPLASAGVGGGIVAASAAAVLALTVVPSAPVPQAQPRSAVTQAASGASSSPAPAPPRMSPSAPAGLAAANLTPPYSVSVYLSPPASPSVGTTPTPRTSAAVSVPTSASPSPSPSPSNSPLPFPSDPQSVTPSPSDSASPTASPTDSSSPTASPTDTPSPTPSPSPSPTPTVTSS
jgi:hypothetical protein